jgi:hypothetical protein
VKTLADTQQRVHERCVHPQQQFGIGRREADAAHPLVDGRETPTDVSSLLLASVDHIAERLRGEAGASSRVLAEVVKLGHRLSDGRVR